MRPVGHQPPDRAEVAGRGEAPGVDDQDRVGQPLDLLEDVRREQDRPAGGGHRAQQRHHVQPLAGVHPVERLVEQQDRRLVDERARPAWPAGACPSSTCRSARSAASVRSTVAIARAAAASGSATPWRRALSRANSRPVRIAVDRLALGDEPDVAVHLGSPPGTARHATRTLPGRRREQPGHQVQQRRLAGAVRPEQAGHAGPQPERDVVDRDDVAVPARDVVELEGGGRRRGRGDRRVAAGGRRLGRHAAIRR